MIELHSAELALTLDPVHGAEILELVDRRSGRQLLGRAPFTPAPPRRGDLDEDTWTASYRGGWQLAAPNAGAPCSVEGVVHGFHGRASVDPWEPVSQAPATATLRWRGHGLELTRGVSITRRTVTAQLSWTATGPPVPLVAVEHISFGPALLDPEVVIATAAHAHESSERDGPVTPPADAAPWPRARLLDGSIEDAGRWPFASPRARYLVLSAFSAGHAELSNPATGAGARIDWDAACLPAAWLWHELRGSGGIWDHAAELLAFEPASVPHGLGLAEAVAAGQAWWARPGERDGYTLSLTVTG